MQGYSLGLLCGVDEIVEAGSKSWLHVPPVLIEVSMRSRVCAPVALVRRESLLSNACRKPELATLPLKHDL
jgi:hypothetical protein